MMKTTLLLLALVAVVAAEDMEELVSRGCRLDAWTCLKVRMVADLECAAASDRYRLTRGLVLTRTHGETPPDDLPLAMVVRRLEEPGLSRRGYLDVVLLKKVLDVFRSHSLTWTLGDRLNATVFRHDEGRGQMDLALQMTVPKHMLSGGKTFGLIGARKRIAMVLMPIVFKLGVMSTLLVGLTVLVLKGLTIGVILLVLAFGNLFGKAAAGWHHPHHQAPWQAPSDIHVHVHVDGQQQHAYHGWHAEPHVEYPAHTAYSRVGQVPDTPRSFVPWDFVDTSPVLQGHSL